MNIKFEYIWLDGHSPMSHIRSKTKILQLDSYDGELEPLPQWSFDGSSTRQAVGGNSDCLLKPVRVYSDPDRISGYLVVCEVSNADGTPHVSNVRAKIDDDSDEFWVGFEQEYIMMTSNRRPIGFPEVGFPAPQGPYYCSVGNQFAAGRNIVEEHLNHCLEAGIGITGINAEVMFGQWEYQCFGKGALRICDDLIVSRYLLFRTAEKYDISVSLHPKRIKGDWNGSGMHANFSYPYLRETGGKDYVEALLEGFRPFHAEHIAEYGAHNALRLTGAHETASMDEFSYGVSDRGCSIRIPVHTVQHDWKGYIEDRRPASNADPYRVVARIQETLKTAHADAVKKVS
jgi:glutamine synthetase